MYSRKWKSLEAIGWGLVVEIQRSKGEARIIMQQDLVALYANNSLSEIPTRSVSKSSKAISSGSS